ncbi:Glycosyltransferase, catalytic subunit of cellulose synthase and poly-beta-1,6-N-acetylglucosamine synthase [bacterium A37T11]|nr:Glycosyltransferase, catalytic subunit of cellulose synthase and poly-beta-1,6-N-acetylglucosamine synthase [bacterium A37T11]
MQVWLICWVVIQVLFGAHLILPLLLGIIALFKRPVRCVPQKLVSEYDYGIIVTAYMQVDLLPAVVETLLRLNYSNYLIYVVADNCDISGLQFNNEKVLLLRPKEILSGNTKSHFYAIQHFKRPHTHLTIIDSDNLVDKEYLNELNAYFALGFKAIQGIRMAKNLDSTYACLDAASDIYYRFIDRKLLFALGSSAALSGSGMAFTTALYRECLEDLKIEGAGFDKVLQMEILKRQLRVAFAEKAVVYDEKTSRSDQLVKQRARWIYTWFKYYRLGIGLLINGLFHLNWNQTLYAIFYLRPPLFLMLLFSFIFMIIDIIFFQHMALYWIGAFFAFFIGFLFSLRYYKAPRPIYRSLLNIPVFIYFQLFSLIKSKKANKISVATTHYYRNDQTNPSNNHLNEL